MTHTEERQELYRDGYDAGFEDGREEGQRGGVLAGLCDALAAVKKNPVPRSRGVRGLGQRASDATAIERLLNDTKGDDGE